MAPDQVVTICAEVASLAAARAQQASADGGHTSRTNPTKISCLDASSLHFWLLFYRDSVGAGGVILHFDPSHLSGISEVGITDIQLSMPPYV